MALAQSRSAQSRSAVGRISTTAIYAVGTGVAAVATFICLMAALWIYSRPYVGSAGAALIVAAAIVALWGLLFLFTRNAPLEQDPVESLLNGIPDSLLKEAQDLFEQNKGSVLLAALVAGLMAGGARGRR